MNLQENMEEVHDEGLAPSIQEQMEQAFDRIDKLKESLPGENLEEEVIEVPDEESNNDEVIIEEEKDQPIKEETLVNNNDINAIGSGEKPKRSARDERRQKYAILNEKMAVEKENEELRKLLDETLNNTNYHFKENITYRREKAEEQRIKALEEGDRAALFEADKAVQRALREEDNLAAWEMEEQRRLAQATQIQQPAVNYVPNQLERQRIDDFLYDHPYLSPNSSMFDSSLHQKVDDYSKRLDPSRPFLSQEYFTAIDDYIDSLKGNKNIQIKAPIHVSAPTKATITPIGAVRGGQSAGVKQPVRITFTADEKYFIERGQVNKDELIKHKLEQLKTKRG